MTSRLLLVVGAIVLLETMSFTVLGPLLPVFAESFDLSRAEAGVLSAIYGIGALAAAIPSGILAVRIGVKATSLGGLMVITGASIGLGLSDSALPLFIARLCQGVGSALAWTGSLGWLVTSTPRHRRGELIGMAMGGAVVGGLLGPVLGGAASTTGTAPAFALFAVCGSLVGAFAWITPAPTSHKSRQSLSQLFQALDEPVIVSGLWLLSLTAFLVGVITLIAPLRLDELGWGAAGISATFVLAAAGRALVNPFVGRWSDTHGRLAPVRLALVFSITLSIALAWGGLRWPTLVLTTAAGIVYGLFWVPGTALLADGAEAAGLEPALGFAILTIAWAPANVVGAAAAGGTAEFLGDGAAFVLAAAACLATLVAIQFRLLTSPLPGRKAM